MINEINYIKIKKNYICFLYISLFSLFSFNFVYIIPFSMGLDQSAYWIYNISNIKHWIYGKDLFYTFGPLGYMVYPMNIGSNLFYTTITFIFIYTYGVYLTYKIININFKNNFSISIVFLAIFSFNPATFLPAFSSPALSLLSELILPDNALNPAVFRLINIPTCVLSMSVFLSLTLRLF